MQPSLAVLPAPQWIILQTIQALVCIALHPLTDGVFINEKDIRGLAVAIPFTDQQQGMTAQAFVGIAFFVFEAFSRFKKIFVCQHLAPFDYSFSKRQILSVHSLTPELGVPGI
jgi:hypothetical protein